MGARVEERSEERSAERFAERSAERPEVGQSGQIAASRHSSFLIRGAARAPSPDPLDPLSPLEPLPVRARVGTRPPSATLSNQAAAVTRRQLQPLSTALAAPPPSAAPSRAAPPPPASAPVPLSEVEPCGSFGAAGTTSFEAIPAFDFAVPSFAASATTLAVPIAEIENPGEQPFSVRVYVTWSGEGGRTATAELGRIIPPPGGTGTFLLPLPAAVRELLRQREGKLRLRLSVRTARRSSAGTASTASTQLPPARPAPHAPALHVKIVQPRWH